MSDAGEAEAAPGPDRGAGPGAGLPRRWLLLAGAGLVSAAGLGAAVGEASRRDALRPPGPPARRAAIWQARVTVPRPQVMAAAGGVVYVAGDEGVNVNPSTAHEVVQALAARDGSRMWTFTVRTGLPPGVIGVASANPPGLAAGPGYVYVMIDRLYCLQADNGATVWSAESPYTVNLAAGPGVVYAVQVTLFALASRDGTQLWSVDVNADVMPALVLAGGVIYMLGYGPQGNAVAAIRASDGARLWATPGPRGGWLACDGTTVCAVSGVGPHVHVQGEPPLPQTQMWTYRADDGTLLYRSAADAGYRSQPAMTEGLAYALTAGNGHAPPKLHAVDPGNGRTVWTYPGASAPPAAARDRIYTASPAGNLIALHARDGTPVWQCPVRVTLGPLIDGDTVYACDDTAVYAIPA